MHPGTKSNRLLFCPSCYSPNLRQSLHCPECGSEDITKSRILEHLPCIYVDLEDKFVTGGKYICPKCKNELKFLGTDYLSLGIVNRCRHCHKIFTEAILRWQCLKCLLPFAEDEAKEIVLQTYSRDKEQRQELEFVLKTKDKFVDFLKSLGYEVTERKGIGGKAGADRIFDIIAYKNAGFVAHILGIDILISNRNEEVGLAEVFRFDSKAYDTGIHDKVLLVFPKLSPEASHFTQRQRIKVFTLKELETFLTSAEASPLSKVNQQPFDFESQTQLVQKLVEHGYSVKEKTKVDGRSGIQYIIDILAEWDDGIIKHSVGIDVLAAQNEVNLEAVVLYDTKAYDIGIHNKVLLVTPRLSSKAKQFARRQGIKVFEVRDAAKLA